MKRFLITFLLAAMIAFSSLGIGAGSASAGAWHCSITTYTWSSSSAIAVQAAVWCPHGHSGWLTAGNTVFSHAYGRDVYVPAGGWAYTTLWIGCTPGYSKIVNPYSIFTSGGQRIENWPGGQLVYCRSGW